MAHEVVNIFGAYIEYFLLYTFLWIFFDTQPQRKLWRIGCHIIVPIFFLMFANHIENMYLRPLLFIICAWFIAFGFLGQGWKKFFCVAVFQIILIFFELLISTVFYPFVDFSKENVYLALNILVKVGSVTILAILFLVSKKYRMFFSVLQTKHTILLLSFSFTSLLLIILTDFMLLRIEDLTLFPIECLAVIMCIASNIGLYYLFYQLSVGEVAKQQLKLIDFHLAQQAEQQNFMEHANREIKKMSHDLKHYLSAIYTLLEQGHVQEAMNELQKRQLEISKNQIIDTAYPVLNSVLNYKLQQAQDLHIQTQLFWNINTPISLNLPDLAVILSNGLDNAIEAAQQITSATPFISVTVDSVGDFIRIVIHNNTNTAPVIRDGKIVTTKKDKLYHGLGLDSIQTLAQRHNGNSFIEFKDNIFTLTVVLQNHSGVITEECDI